jgi:hypothetical protein
MADSKNDNAVPEQHPSTFCGMFDDFPELKDAKLGDMIELKIKGKVVELEAPSKDSKGKAGLEVKSADMTEDEMRDMPAKELRKKLPVKDEESDY